MTVHMEKMKTSLRKNAWPNGVSCSHCARKIQPGQSVMAGHERTQGSVAFHRGCLIGLVQSAWPECMYDEIRKSIIANPGILL